MMITNAHTHLELTNLAALCPPESAFFASWLARLGWRLRNYSRAEALASVERGIAELQDSGTTHVGDVTATWASVEPLLASGLRGVVYLEVLGLNKERGLAKLERAKVAIRAARTRSGYGAMQVGLSLHAPYSCHPELLRAGATWCRAEGVPLCVHVAESPLEMELLLTGRTPGISWPIRLVARGVGILPVDTPHLRPVPYLASLGVLAAHPLLVHAVQVTEDDVRLTAEAGCAVVHCPRSNARLRCGRMPLERYLAAGVPIYLGTDSRASSPSLDVRAEVAFAQHLHAGLVPPERVAELLNRSLP